MGEYGKEVYGQPRRDGHAMQSFVPTSAAITVANSAAWSDLLALLRGRRIVALTGAGCSTESGIPDYRGAGTVRRARNPIQFREYLGSDAMRQRYWARSFTGWTRVAHAEPNGAHRALAELERAGVVGGIITQNVDRLHHAAGSRRVIELHGALEEVVCLRCGAMESRRELQARLRSLNPQWREEVAVEHAPDGDAELDAPMIADFRIAHCRVCHGDLKPNVVFFGENVAKPTVDKAWALFDEAEVLLVAGSSLAVFSGFRFVRRAAERGIPIAIVNIGPTRGDNLASIRVEGRLGTLLPALSSALL